MAEDGGLDLAGFDLRLAVAGPVGIGEEFAAHGWQYLPVGG
jgi:hypothetical protein